MLSSMRVLFCLVYYALGSENKRHTLVRQVQMWQALYWPESKSDAHPHCFNRLPTYLSRTNQKIS